MQIGIVLSKFSLLQMAKDRKNNQAILSHCAWNTFWSEKNHFRLSFWAARTGQKSPRRWSIQSDRNLHLSASWPWARATTSSCTGPPTAKTTTRSTCNTHLPKVKWSIYIWNTSNFVRDKMSDIWAVVVAQQVEQSLLTLEILGSNHLQFLNRHHY